MFARIGSLIERYWQIGVAIGAAWFVVEHLHPELLIRDTTPTGGDTGLHVWSADALRGLLADGRLSGWSPDWFAGFAAFRFYMVLPTLFVVALDLVMPQNVAFKLVAAAGPTLLPIAAFAFARAARLRDPAPALFAVATLPFLFDRYHVIWGGNIAATLAGEIGYSLSLVSGLGALGFVAAGLRTGRWRPGAAALAAVAVLCHPIAALFVVVGWLALVLTAPHPGRAARWSLAPAALAAAATAFWVVPFLVDRSLTVDLGWERVDDVWATLTRLEDGSTSLRWEVGAALIGTVAALVRRRRSEIALVVMAAAFAGLVALLPEGRLWNARVVPLWYLALVLVAALGAVAMVRGLVLGESILRVAPQVEPGRLLGRLPPWLGQWWPIIAISAGAAVALAVSRPLGEVAAAAVLVTLVVEAWTVWMSSPRQASLLPAGLVIVAIVVIAVALPLRSLPGASTGDDGTYRWGPLTTTETSFVPLWAAWNFEGYEAKERDESGGGWDEYSAVVATMADVGAERGCGRAMWEAGRELERYGTPGAMGLLPHWTNGCIASMEGLFFESSASSPFHFVNQVELSTQPLPALRGVDYQGLDVASGIEHLSTWGVRYYLAFSEETVAAARADLDLVEIASSGPWVVFEVSGASVVAPIEVEPVVVIDVDDGSGWRDAAFLAYRGDIDPQVPLVSDGPPEWARVPADALSVGVGAIRIDPTDVTGVVVDDDRISFEVSETGRPVIVRASWFPAWEATGADGPYRMAPNLMVVVPTDNRVELRFGDRPLDRPTQALSAAAIVGIVVMGRTRRPGPRCLGEHSRRSARASTGGVSGR